MYLGSSLDGGVDNQCCCPQGLSTVAAAATADVAGAATVTEIEPDQSSRVEPKAVEDVTEARLGYASTASPASAMI